MHVLVLRLCHCRDLGRTPALSLLSRVTPTPCWTTLIPGTVLRPERLENSRTMRVYMQ